MTLNPVDSEMTGATMMMTGKGVPSEPPLKKRKLNNAGHVAGRDVDDAGDEDGNLGPSEKTVAKKKMTPRAMRKAERRKEKLKEKRAQQKEERRAKASGALKLIKRAAILAMNLGTQSCDFEPKLIESQTGTQSRKRGKRSQEANKKRRKAKRERNRKALRDYKALLANQKSGEETRAISPSAAMDPKGKARAIIVNSAVEVSSDGVDDCSSNEGSPVEETLGNVSNDDGGDSSHNEDTPIEEALGSEAETSLAANPMGKARAIIVELGNDSSDECSSDTSSAAGPKGKARAIVVDLCEDTSDEEGTPEEGTPMEEALVE
ncbi:uncharacterized protein K452DRAFT_308621 [Aplosporella prunicola CBS 121167]|uniref:Uncharacterized protein n=1 Tax=Aplosporella prunicola CBS 121167 TaxID=1176127 RepID=A0A6A6BG37_9PEZI|nr:uncharacterized protein K452DRAFT_308621 [Aplosporella prunicola CBS 121167]KAF2142255.1 hypothetical protein K452DRAFT_308621 [Aplosporella prunicola CBS 121167]